MFKKINAREKLIGWYHSGPKLRASDLEINELFKRYTPNPLLVIIDVQPKEVGVPTDAYFAVEEIKDVSLRESWSCRGRLSLTRYLALGRHNNHQNLRSHAINHRSGRGRGDWRRASSARYPGRRRRHPIHSNYFSTTITPRLTSPITRHRPVSTKSPRRRPTHQPRDPRQSPRCLQPSP